jgi:aminoglycoside phosphotransferase (APT) family kinase protein
LEADLDELAPNGPLTEWLDANVPELGEGPLTTSLLSGGTSNVVLTIQRDRQAMVMRRPPAVPPPGAERGVLREARVLTALNQTDVPRPICYGSCDDAAVVGAPFYVMEKVDGWAPNLRDEKIWNEPPFDKLPFVYNIPFAIVDGLIALANVDYKTIGLGDYGKPGNFLERQVDRWSGQLHSYPEKYPGYRPRKLEGLDVLERWLRDNVRPTAHPGIMHGDVGTPNMMFKWGPPARLAAMIDWELSTIGDPMMDMGWFTGGMRDERFPDFVNTGGLNDANEFPTRQELVRYWCAGTGRDPTEIDYYTLLAGFKSACLLEYKVAQAEVGILPKDVGRFFARIVDESLKKNVEFIRRIS